MVCALQTPKGVAKIDALIFRRDPHRNIRIDALSRQCRTFAHVDGTSGNAQAFTILEREFLSDHSLAGRQAADDQARARLAQERRQGFGSPRRLVIYQNSDRQSQGIGFFFRAHHAISPVQQRPLFAQEQIGDASRRGVISAGGIAQIKNQPFQFISGEQTFAVLANRLRQRLGDATNSEISDFTIIHTGLAERRRV